MSIEPEQPARKAAFLTPIESLRGLAALVVAIGHTTGIVLAIRTSCPLFSCWSLRYALITIYTHMTNAKMAVIVFFVISGFVLGRSLDERKFKISVRAYWQFLLRRVLRLYPAHMAALTLMMVAGAFFIFNHSLDFSPISTMADKVDIFNGTAFHRLTPGMVLQNFLMFDWTLNPVTWSLYVEITAMLVFPFLYVISRRRNIFIDVGLITLLFIGTNYKFDHIYAKYWFCFYLGLIVETHGQRMTLWLKAKTKNAGLCALLAYIGLIVPSLLAPSDPPPAILTGAFFAFCLISVIVFADAKSFLTRVLKSRFLAWNGKISYSFYLYHAFLLTCFYRLFYALLGSADVMHYRVALFFAILTLTVGSGLILGGLSYRYVEKASMRLLCK